MLSLKTLRHISSRPDKQRHVGLTNDIIQSFGLFDNQKLIENELEILRSFTLIKNVVNDMGFEATYFATRNTFMSNLLYDTPITRKRNFITIPLLK